MAWRLLRSKCRAKKAAEWHESCCVQSDLRLTCGSGGAGVACFLLRVFCSQHVKKP